MRLVGKGALLANGRLFNIQSQDKGKKYVVIKEKDESETWKVLK